LALEITHFTNHTNRDLADARAKAGTGSNHSINQVTPNFGTCVLGWVFGDGSQEVSEGFLDLHLQSFMQAPEILQTTAHLLKFCKRQDQSQHDSMVRRAMPCFAMSTAQHSTAQHSTAQHSTAQHSTA